MAQKVVLWPSMFAAFVGMHKFYGYKRTNSQVKKANPWAPNKETLYTQQQSRLDVNNSHYKSIRPMPLIPDDVVQDVEVALELPDAVVPEPDIDDGLLCYLCSLLCITSKPVRREPLIEHAAPQQHVLPDNKLTRGVTVEPAAIRSFILPGLKVTNDKMKITQEFENFIISGELDGCIYDQNGNLVGIVEVKNREHHVISIPDMFDVDNTGHDRAYDLRQLACYWACLPNLEYYYLVQVYEGYIYPTKISTVLLKMLWDSMVGIAEKRSRALRT